MEYRKLGATNLELSAIAYGSFGIGGTMWGGTEKNEAIKAIEASLAHGITTIDTAPFYGLGFSERMIAEAIKGKDRSGLQLLTKFGLVWDGSNNGSGEFFFDVENDGKKYKVFKYASKSSVIKEVEDSLKRLDIDYIDLLQLHFIDSTTPLEETMEALQQLIDQGKILAAGVSNLSMKQLKEAESTILLASNQVPYSMLNRGIEDDLLPYAMLQDIGIIAYSPLERGLLTGKYFNGDTLKAQDHRNNYFQQFDLDKVRILIDEIRPIAAGKNATIAQFVLKWTTLQPGITVVLAGARNEAQAISNAEAINIQLSENDLSFIDTLIENLFNKPGTRSA